MPRKSWRDAIAAYSSPSTLVLLLLGFAAGLPYMLVFSTLSVWLREAGVARDTIGFASLIGLAYAFKWVWSPLLDQWRLPLLGKLGRRRSWLVLSQILIAIGLAGMALCDPQTHLTWLISLAVLVAFASATQDIAVDAYRLEIVDDTRQAALAASYMAGYRVAALLATAGALYFAEGFGSTALLYQHGAWAGTYLLFALMMLPGLLTSLWMREPDVPLRTQLAAARYGFSHQIASVLVLIVLLISVPAMFTQLYHTDFASVINGEASLLDLLLEDRAFLRALLYTILTSLCLSSMGRRGLAPVLTPVNDFILRYRWQAFLLLGLIATYRMSDTVMGVMANVFYIDQGFTKDQIASVSKLFGLVGLIAAEARYLNLANAQVHPAFAYKPETGEERYHSFAGVPIIRRERAVGVLCVQHSDPRRLPEQLGPAEREELQPLHTALLRYSQRPVNLRQALAESALLVCHAT